MEYYLVMVLGLLSYNFRIGGRNGLDNGSFLGVLGGQDR